MANSYYSSRPRPPVEPDAEECQLPTTPVSSTEENVPLYGPPEALAQQSTEGVIEVPDVEVKQEIVEECHHTEMDSRRGR